jgi:hypothetical protein
MLDKSAGASAVKDARECRLTLCLCARGPILQPHSKAETFESSSASCECSIQRKRSKGPACAKCAVPVVTRPVESRWTRLAGTLCSLLWGYLMQPHLSCHSGTA